MTTLLCPPRGGERNRPALHLPSQPATSNVISPKQIQDWAGISRPTAYRLMKLGQFPQLVVLSPNRRVWLKSEVQAWLAGRTAARAGVGGGA
jgi:predicted DNA-binding transcriptional regulator AlpA